MQRQKTNTHVNVLFFALAALVACALPSITFGEQLPVRVFSSADGLSSSVIHHVSRDSSGFLWFCARGGLSRFDGSEFISYQIGNESSPIVQYFFESRDGTFWISTDRGLYRVRRTTDLRPPPTAESPNSGLKSLGAERVSDGGFFALFEDHDGQLWGASQRGAAILENLSEAAISVRYVEFRAAAARDDRNAVRGFVEADDRTLWFVSNAGPIRRLSDGRFVEYSLPRIGEYEQSYSISKDAEGRIWVSHSTGVFVLQPEPESSFGPGVENIVRRAPITSQTVNVVGTIRMPAEGEMVRLDFSDATPANRAGTAVASSVQDIFATADGKMWIPSTTSLYVFEKANYVRLQDINSLPGRSTKIAEDFDGNLWFGTMAGAVRFVRNGLITYNRAGGLTEPSVHSIQETPDGDLLVVHGTWHVSTIRAEGITTTQLNLPEDSRFIWTANPVYLDAAGDVWALSDKGLFRFPQFGSPSQASRPAPRRITHPAIQKDFWYRVFQDRAGNLWFATRNVAERTALYKFDPHSGDWTDISALEGFPKGRPVASFAEDKAGNIWFGFYGDDGIVRFSNGRFEEFGTDDGLPSGSAMSMLIDGLGRLWISSTENGVTRIEDPTASAIRFTTYRETEGLSNNNVRCLVDDSAGNIYAGTVGGVSQIDPGTGSIRTYTTDDGLAADFVQAAFRDRLGNLWFGTANGLSKLDPNRNPPRPAPSVFIRDLVIAGTAYPISVFGQRSVAGIEAGASENNLRVRFFAIGDRKSVRFQYRLEGGADESWRELGEQRSLDFGNLSSASYRLLIRTVSHDGVPTDSPAIVSFRINPPFYRTWWFLTLAVVILMSSVFVLDRFRVAKTRQVQFALTRSRESENRFRTLANTASDAILTIDSNSRIIFVNEAIEKVFGYTPDEIIGQSLSVLMPQRFRDGHASGLNRYLETRRPGLNWEGVPLPGLRKDGQEIPLEVSFGMFERDGETFFTGIARDVSERQRADEALKRAREERIAELQRVRSRIATDLHDDIGSSLTQISVYSELARRKTQSGSADKPLEMITNVANELVDTMSDIVWAINPKKDQLHDLAQRMRRFAANVLTAKNIDMSFAAPDSDIELPLGANIRREVFLIFKETVNNIVRHSEATRAEIRFVLQDDALQLTIADNGVGFDPSNRPDEESGWEKARGGNGLKNMRRRTEELGGKFEIDSTIGGGTSIAILIPLEARDR